MACEARICAFLGQQAKPPTITCGSRRSRVPVLLAVGGLSLHQAYRPHKYSGSLNIGPTPEVCAFLLVICYHVNVRAHSMLVPPLKFAL
jgi:hypothetical protein